IKKFQSRGQLVRSKPKKLTHDRLGQTIQFEQDVAGPHGRHPELRLAFALAHAGFRRTPRDRFVGKNADPEFAFAFHIARKGNSRGFQLRVSDPSAFESLQTKLAKVDSEITRSSPLPTSSLGLPILHAFWH